MPSGRLTPPSIQDGEFGYEPASTSNFDTDGKFDQHDLSDEKATQIGKQIYESSTNWINAGRRLRWNDSLRAFNNMHAQGSKYLSGDYRYRSTLYRPKTRTMVRRGEMLTASAFFSNEDVVSITAEDDDDPKQQASAEILQQLLQYRLTKSIPWFQTLVGARQDCDVMGMAVAKVAWDYEEEFLRTERRPKMGADGQPIHKEGENDIETEETDLYRVKSDKPYIDLIAPENFRFDPGCDWRDPVVKSPYLIEIAPVYVNEALERMESKRGSPAEWQRMAESVLRGSDDNSNDVTRRTREMGRVPGKDQEQGKPQGFDICWTHIYTLRWRGKDWYFRTLAYNGAILEKVRPLEEVYLHGERPYVVGSVIIETHKTYPASKVELTADLQRMANQDMNSRFDATLLNLQPRQFMRAGSGMVAEDLQRFVPGKVVTVNAGKGEALDTVVNWDRPPPVDQASFAEQDRINLDWDDLTGAFSNSSVRSSEVSEQSASGMHLMSGEASGINEYELRCFAETFVEKVIRLLVKLEQNYETDPKILAMAGKRAQLFQKFNVDEITDELLQQEVTVKVNVGVGATNPMMKLKNFATGAQIVGSIFGQTAAMGSNFQEVSKEIFGLLGYKDGARFFKPDYDPRVQIQQEQIQKMQGKQGQGQTGESPAATQAKLQIANINAYAKTQTEQMRAQSDEKRAQLDMQRQEMEEHSETQREMMKLQLQHQHEAGMATQQMHHDVGMQGMQAQQGMLTQGMDMQGQQVQQAGQQQHETQQQGAQFDHQAAQQGDKLEHDATMGKMQIAAKPPPQGGGKGASPQAVPAPVPQQGGGEVDQLAKMFMQGLQQMMQKQDQAMAQTAQAIENLAQAIGGKVAGHGG